MRTMHRPSPGDGAESDGPGRRARGELEADVLATLWAAETPLTAADVQERLGGGLAYSTVVTILSRLHVKGSLDREQQGRAYAYRPVADEPGLAARRMRQVLEGEQDRQRVLARFVADLSPEDERMVRELLRERGGTGGAGRR
jgi:predicted transcriptional regulator